MEACFADVGWSAFDGGGAGIHGRRRGELHRARRRFGQSPVAFPVRRISFCLANVDCDRRQTIRGRRRGFGAVYIWPAVRCGRVRDIPNCLTFLRRKTTASKPCENSRNSASKGRKRGLRIRAIIGGLCSPSTTSLCGLARGSCSKT